MIKKLLLFTKPEILILIILGVLIFAPIMISIYCYLEVEDKTTSDLVIYSLTSASGYTLSLIWLIYRKTHGVKH